MDGTRFTSEDLTGLVVDVGLYAGLPQDPHGETLYTYPARIALFVLRRLVTATLIVNGATGMDTQSYVPDAQGEHY